MNTQEITEKIQSINPETEIEKSIKEDLLVNLQNEDYTTSDYSLAIKEDLQDSPEDYDYTIDDLEVFLFKYELP